MAVAHNLMGNGSVQGLDSQGHPSNAPCSFLVHSQASLAQDIPPQSDSAMSGRQKRRRTSPEDHAILEASYEKNSKPDKIQRTAVVNQVALGEKEVQIWFQNRRQNDRRKSRPLLLHEAVYHFRNSIPQEQTHNLAPSTKNGCDTHQSSCSSIRGGYVRSQHSDVVHEQNHHPSRASSIQDLLNPMSAADCSSSFGSQSTNPPNSQGSQSSQPEPAITSELGRRLDILPSEDRRPEVATRTRCVREFDGTESTQGPAKRSSQQINREKISKPTPTALTESPEAEFVVKATTTKISLESSATNKKRSFDAIKDCAIPVPQNSTARLSMALNGSVKVRTTAEETPSPPKQPMVPLLNLPKQALKRSHSAATAGDLLKSNPVYGSNAVKSALGRSRDARTWEFFCDGDARTALSAQAERENNGSAASAIGLIRSQSRSGRSSRIAKPQARRRWNETVLKPKLKIGGGNGDNETALGTSNPKLVRTTSSTADLSTTIQADGVDKQSATHTKLHARSLSGDSDKENWVPETRSSSHALRRTQSSMGTSRNLLQHHSLAGSRLGDASQHHIYTEDTLLNRANRNVDSFDHRGCEAKGQDLDCIQGLLSLSQGAWR